MKTRRVTLTRAQNLAIALYLRAARELGYSAKQIEQMFASGGVRTIDVPVASRTRRNPRLMPRAEAAPVPLAAERETAPHPRLRKLTALVPLVVIGGVAEPNRLAKLRKQFKNVEWIDNESGKSTSGTDSLVRRMTKGGVAGVLVLHELLSHASYSKIAAASRASGVPIAAAAKGGVA